MWRQERDAGEPTKFDAFDGLYKVTTVGLVVRNSLPTSVLTLFR